jgi:hypothetical protein
MDLKTPQTKPWSRSYPVEQCDSLYNPAGKSQFTITFTSLQINAHHHPFNKFQIIDLTFASRDRQLIQINCTNSIKIYKFLSYERKMDFYKTLQFIVKIYDQDVEEAIYEDPYLLSKSKSVILDFNLKEAKSNFFNLHKEIVTTIQGLNVISDSKNKILADTYSQLRLNNVTEKKIEEVRNSILASNNLMISFQNEVKQLSKSASATKRKILKLKTDEESTMLIMSRRRNLGWIVIISVVAMVLFKYWTFYSDSLSQMHKYLTL